MRGVRWSRSPSPLWRHRDFMLLWSGQTVSQAGSAITMFALPLTAVVVLKASTFQVGLLTAATTAAFAVIALPAGMVVDRLAKRRLMLACDAARMAVIGSVPLAAALGVLTLGQLYAVALMTGVGTVFFDVAYQSYVPGLLARGQLIDANGKLGTTAELARIGGPALGAGLVGLVGAAGAMIGDAGSYAVSVASLAAMRTREVRRERAHGDGPALRGLRAELAGGLSFVLREPILRKIVACTGTANLFGSMGVAMEILFLVRVLHIRPALTGAVFAVGALGGVAGGVASGPLARWIGSARIIWVSILGFGAISVLMPLARPGWGVVLFIAGNAGLSFTAVTYNVAQLSYRQAICPPELLGRMNAAVRWLVWGTLPLGGLIGGAVGTAIGIRPTIWLSVAGGWAAGLWVFFSPLRRMRDAAAMTAGPPAADQAGPETDPAPVAGT